MLIHSTRPRILSAIAGQKHIKKELKHSFTLTTDPNQTGKVKAKTNYNVPDFTLLEGPSGTGKNSVAYIMAKLLLCKSPVENSEGYYEPCNQCSSCTAINNNTYPNSFFYYDGSRMKKENVTRIHETLDTPNHFSKNKVVIIDEAQNLGTSALRSSFLTVTDEPLRYGYLILCTTEPEIFNEALVSRFNRLRFNKIKATEIVDKLINIMQENEITPPQKHYQEFTKRTLPFIAKASNGSLREAIGHLDKCKMSDSWSLKEFQEVSGWQ